MFVAGPGVAPGYLNDPAKSAERFIPPPDALRTAVAKDALVYRTGDQGRILPDGSLQILGRIDSTVKIRGFKVSLHAVEHALEGIEGISRLAVVPVLDEESRQPKALAVYLVGNDGFPSKAALSKARQIARRKLPEYATPRYFIGLDALPIRQGESRKLDVAALPPPSETESEALPRPTSDIEVHIAQAWREALGLSDVRPDDNFFALVRRNAKLPP